MLSKNNFSEKLRKTEDSRQRFSIRKFSVGAASVLIGLTLFGFGTQTVKADTDVPSSENISKENKDAQDQSALESKKQDNGSVAQKDNVPAAKNGMGGGASPYLLIL